MLTLFNSLTQTLEPFTARSGGHEVGIYSCGPTVYARQHLGNLRTYLFADLLKRTLLELGYRVRHVINITDVGHLTDDASLGDDKIELAARTRGEHAREIAQRWTRVFQDDLARLSVLEPERWCRASEHIAEQIAMIEALIAKGLVYELDDGLYFDTSRDPGYGAFGLAANETANSRVEAAGAKRRPADFALWKFSPQSGPRRQLEWASPWGVGFPGWHIECSAMATKYLGAQFDIHTGGIDHIAVHHNNEIAQSENALGVKPWVRYWLHAGWLRSQGEKLSKSSGRALYLDDLEAQGIAPEVFRFYTLGAHYRSPLEFSWEALHAARVAWERLRALAADPVDVEPHHAAVLTTALRRALCRDLDGPAALAVLWKAARDPELAAAPRASVLRLLGGMLGLSFGAAPDVVAAPAPVNALLERRRLARLQADFARADALRLAIASLGFAVEDTPSGQKLRRSSPASPTELSSWPLTGRQPP